MVPPKSGPNILDNEATFSFILGFGPLHGNGVWGKAVFALRDEGIEMIAYVEYSTLRYIDE